jgi:hypothetical protein
MVDGGWWFGLVWFGLVWFGLVSQQDWMSQYNNQESSPFDETTVVMFGDQSTVSLLELTSFFELKIVSVEGLLNKLETGVAVVVEVLMYVQPYNNQLLQFSATATAHANATTTWPIATMVPSVLRHLCILLHELQVEPTKLFVGINGYEVICDFVISLRFVG